MKNRNCLKSMQNVNWIIVSIVGHVIETLLSLGNASHSAYNVTYIGLVIHYRYFYSIWFVRSL